MDITAPPPPNLMSTGQPLSIPPTTHSGATTADAMNSFPNLARGRKRPSAEHREEPPTSRLRREITQEQTPQRYAHDDGHGMNQGPVWEARPRPVDAGNRGGVEQTSEIPGVTTMVTHVSLNSTIIG
jgi:hypothetical protein